MIIVSALLVLVSLIALFVFFFRAITARSRQTTCSLEWLDGFTVESYAPMQRLLKEDDVLFLASQPGYRPEIGKRLMAERRDIFREYLRRLTCDFDQLMGLGKLMVVCSSENRDALAKALWRQEVSFHWTVFAVRCKLALHPLGFAPVDVSPLIETLATMRDRVQLIASQRLEAAQLASAVSAG